MKYTPFDSHTNEELVREVCNKEEPTDLEIALMERFERALEDVLEWKSEALRLAEELETTKAAA